MSVAPSPSHAARTHTPDLPPEPYRFSKADYQKMTEVGIFDHKRVEHIDGIIFYMPGQSHPHRLTVSRLMWLLTPQVDRSAHWIMGQSTLELDEWSPEPDFAVMIGQDTAPDAAKQRSALTIEVSDSSLSHDLKRKARTYAIDAVTEYWVFDVRKRVVHVHREPVGDRYTVIYQMTTDQVLSPLFDPRIRVPIADAMPLTF